MEDLDVVVVGAGLSGVGAGCQLEIDCPNLSYAILEARDDLGGTWDLFRYPGVRSDSDMHTLGFGFRPWIGEDTIAAGGDILEYIRTTAVEYGVDSHIRYRSRAVRANWDSADERWTVTVEAPDGASQRISCRFLYLCTGYYNYDHGHCPDFPGQDDFAGLIVHPQQWPANLDVADQRIIVIGSGATAVTLLPALVHRGARVTMLQRSPTYIASLPSKDASVGRLARVMSAERAQKVVRWRNITMSAASYQFSRRAPETMKKLLRRGVAKQLPPGYDVDRDFTPSYDPWDQRLCLAPDGDFFAAISSGRANVVTGQIETFTTDGIRLTDGTELTADIIVTATGLDLLAGGGIILSVDDKDVVLSDTIGYKGMMLSGVPNMAIALGYTNASWTLKCELVSQYVCRLLNYMAEHGYHVATPQRPPSHEPTHPFIDLSSGYIQRSAAQLPRQGDRPPWRMYQNYFRDVRLMRKSPVTDEGMRFS